MPRWDEFDDALVEEARQRHEILRNQHQEDEWRRVEPLLLGALDAERRCFMSADEGSPIIGNPGFFELRLEYLRQLGPVRQYEPTPMYTVKRVACPRCGSPDGTLAYEDGRLDTISVCGACGG